MTENLIREIKRVDIRIDPAELERCFRQRLLSKNEVLLDFHSVCRHYYFVDSGALRVFFLEDGEEHTAWFAFENYFFTELESYTNGTASRYRIVATEDTELLQIPKTDMEFLLSRYDWWKEFLLYTQQQIILKLTGVVRSFQTQSAEERYDALFTHPDYIQRTKQKDLSSLMGITRYSLSRLRKKRR